MKPNALLRNHLHVISLVIFTENMLKNYVCSIDLFTGTLGC